MNIVAILILINIIISFLGFNDSYFKNKYLFFPYRDNLSKRWLPFIVSAFLHTDMLHLLFNMLALSSFGGFGLLGASPEYGSFLHSVVQLGFYNFKTLIFMICYLGGILSSNFIIYFRNRYNPNHRSLGASAGVGAIIAAAIAMVPYLRLSFYILPIPIPGILFEILFLVYSFLMRNKNTGTSHLAHFIGSLYGLLFGFFIKHVLVLL